MLQRRSSRINARGGGTYEADQKSPESDQEAQEAQDGQRRPSRKRQKRTVTGISASPAIPKLKGRRGKLRMLPEMPLDILFEIFGHLTPSDLLHLARTTKPLRHILMRRSTISVWKQAFSNEPSLPACPPDLNEPQFANLLFGRHCHFCSRPNIQEVLWAHRMRACGDCVSKRFVYTGFYHNNLFPVSSYRRRGRHFSYSLASARVDVNQELTRLQDSPSDLAQFRLERTQHVTRLHDHARECQRWQDDLKRNRVLELSDNRTRRRDAIFAKLVELGWKEELEFLKTSHFDKRLCDHPLVKQSKDLTERTWNNIKDELVEFLQTIKAARLRTEHISFMKKRMQGLENLVRQFYSTRATNEVLPVPADFCNMEPYRTSIMDAVHEDVPTPLILQEHISQLSDLSAVWLHNCNQFLLSLIPSTSTLKVATSDNLALLHLATTCFHCQHCRDLIAYPGILEHQCITSCQSGIRESQLKDDFLAGCRGIESEPWNYGGNQLEFDCKASNYAREILTVCKMDPNTVTSSEMDKLDHRIECSHCFDMKKGRLVMHWRTAISHDYKCHFENRETSKSHWILVDKATALKSRKKEAKCLASNPTWLCCRLCRMRFHGYHTNSHMSAHHTTDPAVSDPTFPCRDVSMDLHPAVRIRVPKSLF